MQGVRRAVARWGKAVAGEAAGEAAGEVVAVVFAIAVLSGVIRRMTLLR